MLPRKYRLPGYLVPSTLNSPRFFSSPLFSLKLADSSNQPSPSRVAFIVSTKIAKTAVDRNHLKRQLKVALIKFLPQLKKGHSLVFLVKHPLKTASLSQTTLVLKNLLSQARLIGSFKKQK